MLAFRCGRRGSSRLKYLQKVSWKSRCSPRPWRGEAGKREKAFYMRKLVWHVLGTPLTKHVDSCWPGLEVPSWQSTLTGFQLFIVIKHLHKGKWCFQKINLAEAYVLNWWLKQNCRCNWPGTRMGKMCKECTGGVRRTFREKLLGLGNWLATCPKTEPSIKNKPWLSVEDH